MNLNSSLGFIFLFLIGVDLSVASTYGSNAIVSGSLTVSGTSTLAQMSVSGDLSLAASKTLFFTSTGGGQTIGLQGAPTNTVSYNLQLPDAIPTANQVLFADPITPTHLKWGGALFNSSSCPTFGLDQALCTITIGHGATGTNSDTVRIADFVTGGVSTVSIGTGITGSGKAVVTIGSTVGASSVELRAGSGSVILTSASVDIAKSQAAPVVNIATSSSSTAVVNIATSATNAATVTIGSTISTSKVTIQAGTAGISLAQDATLDNTKGLIFLDATAVTPLKLKFQMKAAATLTSPATDLTYNLPSVGPTAGQFLVATLPSSGSSDLSWSNTLPDSTSFTCPIGLGSAAGCQVTIGNSGASTKVTIDGGTGATNGVTIGTGTGSTVTIGNTGGAIALKTDATLDNTKGLIFLDATAVTPLKLKFQMKAAATLTSPATDLTYNLPSVGPTAGQFLVATLPSSGRSDLNWMSRSFVSAKPGDPGTTQSSNERHFGYGNPSSAPTCRITPSSLGSGTVMFSFQGTLTAGSSAGGDTWTLKLRYAQQSVTSAPACCSTAAAGTDSGAVLTWSAVANNVKYQFAMQVIVSGLSVGSQYWFDLTMTSSSGASNHGVTPTGVVCNSFEI